jgi:predicted nucleic acid-binding protein
VLGRVDEPDKFRIGRDLVASWDFGVSTQVLGEFYVTVQRMSQRPLAAVDAAQFVLGFSERPCVPIDQAMVYTAMEYSQTFKLSYRDAAIIAAAERLEAPVVYSEDFHHGQSYGSVRVMNPFV